MSEQILSAPICAHCGRPEHAGIAGDATVMTPLQYLRRVKAERLKDDELARADDALRGYITGRRRRGVPTLGTIHDEVMA